MNEWLMIVTMMVSGGLYSAGGTDIPGIGGQKWLRRFVLPIFLSGMAVLCGISYWQSAIILTLALPLSMGYGDSSGYWKKALTFSMMTLPTLAIGWSWWVVINPIVLLLMFVGSNWEPLAKSLFWKCVEFLTGVLISIALIAAINNKWSF